jgi:hypothetical protein
MAAFLIATLTNSGIQFRPLVATSLATAESAIQTAVTRQLATGLPFYQGFPSLESLTGENLGGNTGRLDGELQIGVITIAAAGRLALGGTTVTWT